MQIKPLLLAATALIAVTASAQKIKKTEGDIAPFKSEKAVNIEFSYDDMSVGKFKTEKEYVETKTAEYNKSEAGKGDKWAKSWVDDRAARYEKKFAELFTEASGKAADASAKYTLIFHTTFTEPGFNVGVMRKNAYIDAEALIVETANKKNIIARIAVDKAPGRDVMGYDFDTGWRISEAYAKAGKSLGKFLK